MLVCWLCLLLAVEAVEPVQPVEGQSLTLADALEQALEANLEIRQDRLSLVQAEKGVKQQQGAFDPALVLGVDAGRYTSSVMYDDGSEAPYVSESVGWNAGLSQALPTGGGVALTWTTDVDFANPAGGAAGYDDQLYLSLSHPLLQGIGPRAARYGVREAVRQYDREKIAYRESVEQLALQVSDSYWQLLAARENLQLTRRSLEIAEEQFEQTTERLGEGFAATGDLLQVKRMTGVARQAVVVAEAREESASQSFNRLLGIPVVGQSPVRLADHPSVPDADPELDRALATARQYNAGILQEAIDLAAVEDATRVARNSALPSLDLGGAVGLFGSAEDAGEALSQVGRRTYPSWSVGLDFSMPIPGRQPFNELARQELQLERASLEMEAALTDLELDTREAVRDVRRDRMRVQLATETVEAARAALDADRELLRDGRGSTRDVVLSLEALDEAQISKLSAEIDLQSSMLRLQQVQGTLLGSLGLTIL